MDQEREHVVPKLFGVPMEDRPTFRRWEEVVVHTNAGLCFVLLLAGIETTAAALGNAAALLDLERGERKLLLDDPARISTAAVEVLRFDPSVQRIRRTLTLDVGLNEQRLAEGECVHLFFAETNCDAVLHAAALVHLRTSSTRSVAETTTAYARSEAEARVYLHGIARGEAEEPYRDTLR